jgi:hypothetical protein
MNTTIAPQIHGPDVRAVHVDMARAHRDASLSLRYTVPGAAKVCRKLMRLHALKARGKIN